MASKQIEQDIDKEISVNTGSVDDGFEKLKESKYNPQEQKDKTRSEIALFFVKSYISLVIFIFVSVFIYNLILLTIDKENFVLDIKDIFPLVIGTVGTLLGFVLGYYFKGQEKE